VGTPPEAERRLSEDGLFAWRPDLYVWEPVGIIPVGTETPDSRFKLTDEGWIAQRQTVSPLSRPSQKKSFARAGLAVVMGLALVGGALLVGFILLIGLAVSSQPSASYSGGKGI
jgi:hypothetical protein